MDLAQTWSGDDIEDASPAKSPSSESTSICDVFGDPDALPRIGDQYQVDIPTLITESDYLQLTSYPTDAATMTSASHHFLLGLPIPVMWVTEGVEKHEPLELLGASNNCLPVESDDIKETHIRLTKEDAELIIEPSEVLMGNELCMGGSVNLALQQEMKEEMHKKCGGKSHSAPGSLSDSWCDLEKASFLLALYIFGKNLVQVKRFIESKTMGDLLSFYYGEFYKSAEYRRWAECRKMRRRKCIYGPKIFTGLRQQELLSRLLPRLSEECQNILLEVFYETISYIFSCYNFLNKDESIMLVTHFCHAV